MHLENGKVWHYDRVEHAEMEIFSYVNAISPNTSISCLAYSIHKSECSAEFQLFFFSITS